MHSRQLAILACVSAAWITPAYADDGPFAASGSSAYVELGRYRTPFTYTGSNPQDVHIGHYGVVYREPVSDTFDLGLLGGYLTFDVDKDPAASQVDYNGRYLGLLGHFETRTGDYVNLSGEFQYVWNDASGNGFFEQSQATWYDSYAELGPVFRVDRWRFKVGGYYQQLDGDETDSGAIAQHRNIESTSGGGGYLGIVYYLDRTGSLGLIGTSGSRKGFKLVFRREF